MQFDTSKHKIRKLWGESEENNNKIDFAKIKQNKKELSVKLAEYNNTQLNQFRSFNSEWIPMDVIFPWEEADSNIYQVGEFSVELTLPEIYIPFARISLAFKRGSGEEVFESNWDYTQFSQIFNTDKDNIKRIIWNLALTQLTVNTESFKDFEIKLFFTFINPLYSTAS